VYKDHFSTPISAIIEADYRLDGRVEVIACGSDGEVRGYLPAEGEQIGNLMDANTEEDAIAELVQRKQELLYELKTYEENSKATPGQNAPIIPPDTNISCTWAVNQEASCVELVISTNNDTVIRAIIIFAEQLFENESKLVHPKNPTSKIHVPISSPKDISTDLFLKVMVGTRSSSTFHVFEHSYKLPKFSMYLPSADSALREPESSVTFYINERVNRVVMWMNNSFNIQYEHYGAESLNVAFTSLRDNRPLMIRMENKGSNQVQILTDDMDLAAELVQDMSAYLTISELESIANFPAEMSEFRNVLLKVDEFNATRLKLTAEMADTSNLVKTLVIKAEDARILNDIKLMKRMYTDLYDLNRELIGEHIKRSNNHQELLSSLKQVNQMIQKAARLRVGNAKTRVVAACRNAIKSNNIHALFKIIQTGTER
jgi:Bardet-Biedl syndrome 2 protein